MTLHYKAALLISSVVTQEKNLWCFFFSFFLSLCLKRQLRVVISVRCPGLPEQLINSSTYSSTRVPVENVGCLMCQRQIFIIFFSYAANHKHSRVLLQTFCPTTLFEAQGFLQPAPTVWVKAGTGAQWRGKGKHGPGFFIYQTCTRLVVG